VNEFALALPTAKLLPTNANTIVMKVRGAFGRLDGILLKTTPG
jgi:hypothetical protein